MPTVDVVIPCYNYARFLPRCVESVLTQPGVDVRVLIIDDASKDDTAAVGERLSAEDGRTRFSRHAVNRGHIRTYNEGLIDWASSEYSLLLSADDLLAPGALARATAVLDRNADMSMVYGMALSFVGEDIPPAVPAFADEHEARVASSAKFIEHCFKFGNGVPTPTAVVRTKLQHELGGYDPELKHSGDMEMWLRFASRGSVGVLRSIQAYYRHHAKNMSKQYLEAAFADARERLTAYISFNARNQLHIGKHAGLPQTLNRQISEQALWLANRALDLGYGAEADKALTIARAHDASIVESKVWGRVHFKKRFGEKRWPMVRSILSKLRLLDSEIVSNDGAPADSASHWRSGFWPDDSVAARLQPTTV